MERTTGPPQMEKLILMRMKSKQELGMNSSNRISEVEIPLLMTQAKEFIARGSAHIRDTQGRFYYGLIRFFKAHA